MFTRSPQGYPGMQRRRTLVVVALVVVAVYLFLTGLSTVWTDYLWFRSVGFEQVWRTNLLVSVGLAVAGVGVAFLFVWANLLLTDRLSPRYGLAGVDDEVVERFREWAEPRLRFLRLGVAGLFGLLLGGGLAAWRGDLLLFVRGSSFGSTDPLFNRDLSFFMFRLPLYSELAAWVFSLVALTGILVAALHYLNGGIRYRRETGLSAAFGVKAHVSGLAAVLALVRAVQYRIDAYQLVYSNQSAAYGAGYTDVTARLPALNLLALVSLAAAVLFLLNMRRPGWTLAIVSVGSWVFVSVAAGLIYPAVVQRFRVTPDELAKETPYIQRNIAMTRAAFGLASVDVRSFTAAGTITSADLAADQDTIRNLRLWDPAVLTKTYQNLQEIRPYYRVDRVDTDRYTLEGVPTQMMVAVRELDEPHLPARDWQNERLIYTHGFGAVLSPANTVQPDGQPDFLLKDVPPVSSDPSLDLTQPRIYFGETYNPGSPVIVRTGTAPQEVDYPRGANETPALFQYDGKAGVTLDGILPRLAFALRYRDLNILISGQLRSDSKILMERNIGARVEKIAPFLSMDGDPYPVVLDGRIIWVVDLYTLSDHYPYSRPVSPDETLRLTRSSGLPVAGFNYIRNSVKATVDAYDGTVHLYLVDPTDPVAQAWKATYPGLFTDPSQMPAGLQAHLRYPEDLFKIQSEVYRDYHMDDPAVFFRRDDAWDIPEDASTIRRSAPQDLLRGDVVSATGSSITYYKKTLPYYILMRLPGEDHNSYVILQPFNPKEKRNMASFLVADSTPGTYGRLVEFRLPRSSVIDGPGQVANRINQNSEISQQITLWNAKGSGIVFGSLLVVPIKDSIMYVQPVYLEAEQGGLPEFRRVIVVYKDAIEWRPTLTDAINAVFGSASGQPTQPGTQATVDQLLQQASDAFAAAEEALKAGDLSGYQQNVDKARSYIEQAKTLLDQSTSATRAASLS